MVAGKECGSDACLADDDDSVDDSEEDPEDEASNSSSGTEEGELEEEELVVSVEESFQSSALELVQETSEKVEAPNFNCSIDGCAADKNGKCKSCSGRCCQFHLVGPDSVCIKCIVDAGKAVKGQNRSKKYTNSLFSAIAQSAT